MTQQELDKLQEYINAAFEGDEEIFLYYDRSQLVEKIEDICFNVREKIAVNYPDATWHGFSDEGVKIGFVVFQESLPEKKTLLISFGINKKYRTPETLKDIWAAIKLLCGDNFNCVLYSYNTRAISWLEKCGMKKVFENVTILSSCQQEDY